MLYLLKPVESAIGKNVVFTTIPVELGEASLIRTLVCVFYPLFLEKEISYFFMSKN